jgi:hypothetical protein
MTPAYSFIKIGREAGRSAELAAIANSLLMFQCRAKFIALLQLTFLLVRQSAKAHFCQLYTSVFRENLA